MADIDIVLPSKPKIIKEDELAGTYEIEGLYPGYGHTLGNSLRRIILSSLPGSAITSVKVNGVDHEFSSIPGVKEDVLAIILNLKKVCFRLAGAEPSVLHLEAKGVGEVKAGDISVDGQTEVLNKDLYLASLTDKKASLEIELVVERGLGYLPKEVVSQGKSEIGAIFLDAVFTPIRRVSYEVENMRVGDRTDFNRLRIHIETDGSLTPHEALGHSIEVMINQLRSIVGFKEEVKEPVAPEEESVEIEKGKGRERDTDAAEALKTKVEELSLSARTQKALANEGVRTVGGLVRKKESDLEEMGGLGEKGIQEIKKALSNFGLTLKE